MAEEVLSFFGKVYTEEQHIHESVLRGYAKCAWPQVYASPTLAELHA